MSISQFQIGQVQSLTRQDSSKLAAYIIKSVSDWTGTVPDLTWQLRNWLLMSLSQFQIGQVKSLTRQDSSQLAAYVIKSVSDWTGTDPDQTGQLQTGYLCHSVSFRLDRYSPWPDRTAPNWLHMPVSQFQIGQVQSLTRQDSSKLAAYAIKSVSDWTGTPASILRKSTSGRHRPVSYPDGPMTARYRFT